MKRLYITAVLYLISVLANGQVILFSDSLTAGGGNWNLETGSGPPAWTVNGTYSCSETSPDNGGGNYMHIYDSWFDDDCNVAGYNGIGSGTGGSFIYSTMKNSISTVNQTAVSISFDWLCVGQTGSVLPTYGTIDYSIDGGTSWTNITQPRSRYSGQSSWTTITINSTQVSSLLNQTDLKIRFGFISSSYGADPAFGIDNIVITGDFATSAKGLDALKEINIYPNPVQEVLYLKSTVKNTDAVTVTDILGKRMNVEMKIVSGTVSINTGGMQPGIYILRLDTKEGIIVNRFIKK